MTDSPRTRELEDTATQVPTTSTNDDTTSVALASTTNTEAEMPSKLTVA